MGICILTSSLGDPLQGERQGLKKSSCLPVVWKWQFSQTFWWESLNLLGKVQRAQGAAPAACVPTMAPLPTPPTLTPVLAPGAQDKGSAKSICPAVQVLPWSFRKCLSLKFHCFFTSPPSLTAPTPLLNIC
jgi:hypothetical protein